MNTSLSSGRRIAVEGVGGMGIAAVKERPILFSAPMVRALLAGTKTQTRRVVKELAPGARYQGLERDGSHLFSKGPFYAKLRCPYGAPGDRLWVREAWQYADWTEDGEPWIAYSAGGENLLCRTFEEDWGDRLGDIWAGLSSPENYSIDGRAADRRWRPSIHMPRWASRLTLEVTGVRVERLQDISEADAIAEGIERRGDGWQRYHVDPDAPTGQPFTRNPVLAYRGVWESINGPGSWDANPWVWVVAFQRLA